MSANAVTAALYSKLSSDGTLTGMLAGTTAVYQGVAPAGAATPFVVFDTQAAVDTYVLGGRATEDYLFLVKAITKGRSAARAGTIADRVDAVLTDGTLSVSGQNHLYLRREGQIRYEEIDQGDTYWHVGGQFRIVVQ